MPFTTTTPGQLHGHILPITPIKNGRRKSPSFALTKATETPIQPSLDISASSLDFEEFSLWDTECLNHNPSTNYLILLGEYLSTEYGVDDFLTMNPFIILRRRDGPPAPERRLFTVAGCIAVWTGIDDLLPCIELGSISATHDYLLELELEDALISELVSYGMPKPETLLTILKRHFPQAIAISFTCRTLVIEFEEVNVQVWRERLAKFPLSIKGSRIGLNYSNGALTKSGFACEEGSNSQLADSLQEDDSDYVKSQGCFYPGTMLSTGTGDRVNAGVLVQKDNEVRLTIPLLSGNEHGTMPDRQGSSEHPPVTQGETEVGYVDDKMGNIGLAKIHDGVNFSNRFLDFEGTANTLIPLNEISQRDTFVMDSFVTGRQVLRSAGVRVVPTQNALSSPGNGGHLHQGIFVTNVDEIQNTSRLRVGASGAAIVRLRKGDVDVSENGEVCGFIHCPNPPPKLAGGLFYFADCADELIGAGWNCVTVPKKRQVDLEDTDLSREAFAKKRR